MATLDVDSVPGGGRIALQTQRQGSGLGVVPRVGTCALRCAGGVQPALAPGDGCRAQLGSGCRSSALGVAGRSPDAQGL